MKTRIVRLLALVAFLAAAACGDDGGSPAATGGPIPGAPTTTSAGPARIVSLSPTATEMLFAIGAGAQVVAVDDQSNYPPEAPRTDLSGFTPNVEAIASKNPQLVVIAADMGGLKKSLENLGVTVLLQTPASTLDDAYAQVTALGAATGHADGAAKVVTDMKAGVAAAVARAPKPTSPIRLYHELDSALYTVSSKSFVGSLYNTLGLVNIADAADKDGTGYPQLTNEYVIAQNPDVILLANAQCCGESAKTVAARPGWGQIAAVSKGAVIPLDADLASRWGPRTPLFMDQLVTALAKVTPN